MKNYFRITAYHPQTNSSAIIDCYGKFDAIWKFSSMLVCKGLKVLAVGDTQKFNFGDLSAAKTDEQDIILRACGVGEPKRNGNTIDVNGKQYTII